MKKKPILLRIRQRLRTLRHNIMWKLGLCPVCRNSLNGHRRVCPTCWENDGPY